jgi:septal ring factor EnvC (AmiA/AmiB activator)
VCDILIIVIMIKNRQLHQHINGSVIKRSLCLILLLAMILVSSVGNNRQQIVFAETKSDLQAKSAALSAEINANNQKISQLQDVAQTYVARVEQLNLEITQASKQIDFTVIKVAQLKTKLIETQAELDRQKDLLKASIRILYQRTGATTIELLASSDSFSEFISAQDSLERLRNAVDLSTQKVIAIKQQLQLEEQAQKDLLVSQEVQKSVLSGKQKEQQQLYDDTKGEESKFQQLISSQETQLAATETELRKLIATTSLVSQGRVAKGQRLGSMGSTGYSTGPHLHFMVVDGGETTSPRNYVNGRVGWPTPNQGLGDVSQEFGCVAPAGYYSTLCSNGLSFHTGLDIAGWYGEPIVAVADGNIVFRGCKAGLGFLVIVDHGNGLQTYYPHMITPSGQTSGYCSE